jgi:hypothetical protein
MLGLNILSEISSVHQQPFDSSNMSQKAKNLHFEAKQPAFLRRLRGEVDNLTTNSSRDLSQDRRKRTLKPSDEDDHPTYILEESGSTISKAEYEALLSSKDSAFKGEQEAVTPGPDGKQLSPSSTKPSESATAKSVATIGINSKKRKATQIVTEDLIGGRDTGSSIESASRPANVKSRKKSKAIKLSFREDDEK